jgi:hypothetical protein
MWRGLYRDHWLLGAYKDTKTQSAAIIIDEGAGSPESWEGSYPLSPFSSLNLSTGNLFTSIPIVSFSGRGLSVSLPLFHNSASSSSLQPFGYGWTHSYNWKIQRDSQTGDAIVVRGTGRKHRYTYNAQSGTFTPPAGVYDELVRHPDGTWTLTFKDQTKMHFDSSGKLHRHRGQKRKPSHSQLRQLWSPHPSSGSVRKGFEFRLRKQRFGREWWFRRI